MVSQFFPCPIEDPEKASNFKQAMLQLFRVGGVFGSPCQWQNHRTAFTVGSAGAGGASILYGTVTIGGTGWAGCWTFATSCAAVAG